MSLGESFILSIGNSIVGDEKTCEDEPRREGEPVSEMREGTGP